MATFKSPLLGTLRGKIGNTVAVKRGNQNILMPISERSKNYSEVQVLQQKRFKETLSMMRLFKPAITVGFKSSSSSLNSFNRAMQVNAPALIGDSPNYIWDYSAIKLSEGEQSPIYVESCESTITKVIDVSWSDNADSGSEFSLNSDSISFFCLSEEKGQVIVKNKAVVRESLSASIALPQAFVGDSIHVWAFVNGSSNGYVSNSTYLGTVTLA